MLRVLSITLFAWLLSACRQPAGDLQSELEALVQTFHGRAGIYAHHLRSGETFAVNADSLFPTASMIKVPILIRIFERIEKGDYDYRQKLIWSKDSVNYPEGGILSSFQEGKKISLSEVISLMITYSDNHAALWCQKMAGGGAAINRWLEENGFHFTRVNSRTPGRHGHWQRYGWGQSTPREMAELLVRIRDGSVVSAAACDKMYRHLTNIYWNDEALSQIPPWVQAASKQGAVDEARSEVVLVNGPSGDYVFCVMTDAQADTSWGYSNEGFVLIRKVSRLLWKHFEPESDWQPPPGWKRFAYPE